MRELLADLAQHLLADAGVHMRAHTWYMRIHAQSCVCMSMLCMPLCVFAKCNGPPLIVSFRRSLAEWCA